MWRKEFKPADRCSGGCTDVCSEAVAINTALHLDGPIAKKVEAVKEAFNGSKCNHPQSRSAHGRADKFIKEHKEA